MSQHEWEERLSALERTVAALNGPSGTTDDAAQGDQPGRPFWMVEQLAAEATGSGAVGFAGTFEMPGRGPVRWQWAKSTDEVLEWDWGSQAGVFDALGNPVRLRLLSAVVGGAESTAELAGLDELGTTGQLHHHLRALTAAGWLESVGRGRWRVPPTRVIALLVILAAGRGQ